MKAFVINKPFDSGVYEVEKPIPKNDEVLIKVRAAGFCGTDIHTYKGEHPTIYPIIPGHEFSGIIEECGENVRHFKPGDTVVADPNIFCENCDACKSNHQIHCENIQVIGNTRNGAFAEYVAVPERCVFKVSGADLDLYSMAEPLACCINSHNKINLRLGARVLILGAGTIGLMQLLLCKRRGVSSVTVIDVKPGQLKIAKALGADVVMLSDASIEKKLMEKQSKGFDMVIDATGVASVVEMGVRLLATNGIMLMFGACPPNSKININPFDIYYKDLRLIGSYALEKTLGQSLSMLEEGGINLAPLVGQKITLNDMPHVFSDFVEGKTANKILVTFK